MISACRCRTGRSSGSSARREPARPPQSGCSPAPWVPQKVPPTAGIDPFLRDRLWDELHRLRDDGRTLIVTTQYVSKAESCDTVALISGGRLIALAPPDGLRRSAIGGDLVEIETATPFEGTELKRLDLVHEVEQVDPTHLRVIVADAAAAVPDVVEAIRQRDGEVTSARETRPSFDTVFATLVERDRIAHEAAPAADILDQGAAA